NWMAETSPDFGDEHIVIYMDPGGPIELDEFQESLAALARIYRRQHGVEGADAPQSKLYVTRIVSGSIELEIVPLLALLGMPISFMDSVNTIREFSKWVGTHLAAVADSALSTGGLNREEAKDLQAFVRPLTGRKDANLRVTHARFRRTEKTAGAEREIVVEYKFDESDINRAAINLRKITDEDSTRQDPGLRTRTVREVLMAFQQADKNPGKERGRTGDRVVISDVTDKPLPVYFPQEAAAIKRRILEQTENPFSKGYIVDAVVHFVGDDDPKMYSVINLHDIVDLE
ncbi:MAG: hypothetical protein NW223_00225, partial [Hyphomicrobiaceae bacterium]|nr:hypothetical protein [Hyphomicrobiaceae bacterium]